MPEQYQNDRFGFPGHLSPNFRQYQDVLLLSYSDVKYFFGQSYDRPGKYRTGHDTGKYRYIAPHSADYS